MFLSGTCVHLHPSFPWGGAFWILVGMGSHWWCRWAGTWSPWRLGCLRSSRVGAGTRSSTSLTLTWNTRGRLEGPSYWLWLKVGLVLAKAQHWRLRPMVLPYRRASAWRADQSPNRNQCCQECPRQQTRTESMFERTLQSAWIWNSQVTWTQCQSHSSRLE